MSIVKGSALVLVLGLGLGAREAAGDERAAASPLEEMAPPPPPATPSLPPPPQDDPTLEGARRLLAERRPAEAESAAREVLADLEAQGKGASLEAAAALEVLVEALVVGGRVRAAGAEWRELSARAVRIRLAPADASGQPGPGSPLELERAGDWLHRLGFLLYSAAALEEAAGAFEEAVQLRTRAAGRMSARVAESLNNLASALLATGETTRARALLREALEIREQLPGRPNVASTLTNLAGLEWQTGELARARTHLERATGILREGAAREGPRGSGDGLRLAKALNVLGLVLQAIGDLDEARGALEEALRILRDAGEKGVGDTPKVLANLGLVLLELGDADLARRRLEEALEAWREHPNASRAPVAACLNHLGWALQLAGDLPAARARYEEALALREEALGPDHPDLAWTLSNLGLLCEEEGEIVSARRHHERSLVIREAALGPDHPLVAQSLGDLARVRALTGDRKEALALALRAEEIGREHARLTLRALPERQALYHAALRSARGRRTEALDIILELARGDLGPERSRDAFDALIRSRALVLDELIARGRAVTRGADSDAQGRGSALLEARERLANLLVRGPGDEGAGRYRALVEEARRAAETEERAVASAILQGDAGALSARVGLDEVARALPEDSALIAYARHAGGLRPGAPAVFTAFVLVSGAGPDVVSLGLASDVETAVARTLHEAARGARAPGPSAASNRALETRSGTSPQERDAERRFRAEGEALRRAIWDPVTGRLGGARRVFIVPDGALHLLSFAALAVGEAGYLADGSRRLQLLSTERDLVEGPGSVGLGQGAGGGSGAGLASGLLVLAAPDFEQTATVRGQPFVPLPATRLEAQGLERLWRGAARPRPDRGPPEPVTVLLGARASEAAFKREAPGKRVLHLATHGFFLAAGAGQLAFEPATAGQGQTLATRGIGRVVAARRPRQSELGREADHGKVFEEILDGGLAGLALAAGPVAPGGPVEPAGLGAETSGDGILLAEEVAALDLRGVEVAVLSACDTGSGEARVGEGVLGLRRAFRVAGVETLVLSLWEVEDEAARAWMESFYTGWLVQDQSVDEAAWEASRSLLRSRRTAGQSTHPFWWAGFIAAGRR